MSSPRIARRGAQSGLRFRPAPADLRSPQRTGIKRRRLTATSGSAPADSAPATSTAKRNNGSDIDSDADSENDDDASVASSTLATDSSLPSGPPPRAAEDPSATWIGNHIRSLSDGPLPHARDLGILLGHRVVKRFYPDENDVADLGRLYMGTVVAYKPPGPGDAPVKIWDGGVADGGSSSSGGRGGTAAAELAITAAVGLVAPGVYKVLFDDSDREDMEPSDLYRCALEYHVQVSLSCNVDASPYSLFLYYGGVLPCRSICPIIPQR